MNRHLPFALSAIGLISLAIHQPAMAQQSNPAPTLTIEIVNGEGGVQPPEGVLQAKGAPLTDSKGNFFVLPASGNYSNLIINIDPPGGIAGGFSLNFASLPTTLQLQSAIDAAVLAQGPNNEPLFLSAVLTLVDGKVDFRTSDFVARGVILPAGPARPIATPANLGNAVIANSFADPSSVTASQTNVLAGAAVENAVNATLAASSNALSANATVINQLASQSIATGEDSLAVAVLDTTVDNTTSTATITGSVVGVSALPSKASTFSGNTSVTVDGNTAVATARANDSLSLLSATGANAGVAGNGSASPDNDNTFPAPGPLVIEGDLLATGVQQLDQQSNVSASVLGSTIGLAGNGQALQINAITGGVSLSDNRLAAVADGNRLSLQLTDALSGGDVDSTVYGLQTVSDTNVSATVEGSGADVLSGSGVLTGSITSSASTLADNTVQAAAAANRATTTVVARPDQASDELLVDVEQFVRAQNEPVIITGAVINSGIGIGAATLTSALNTLSNNQLTGVAIGNDQATTADLGQGSLEGETRIEGNQTLVLDGASLTIGGGVIDSSIATNVLLTDESSRTTLSANTVIGQAVGNNASQALGDFAGVRGNDVTVEQTQRVTGDAAELLLVQGTVDGVTLGAVADVLAGPQLTISDNQVAALSTINRSAQSTGVQSGGSEQGDVLTLLADQAADSINVAATVDTLLIGPSAATAITAGVGSPDALITLSNNRVDAQAELNRSVQSLAGLSGTHEGRVDLDTVQDANAAAGGLSSVRATLADVGIGLYDSTALLDVDSGSLNLTASGNALTAQANANLAQTGFGAVSGTVNAVSAASVEQLASDTDVGAENIDIGLGIAEAGQLAAPVFTATTDAVALTVSNNSVQALARQNNGSVSSGLAAGQFLGSADLAQEIVQTTSGASITTARNEGVFAGVTPALGNAPLGLGLAADGTQLSVTSNTLRADAADNLASVIGGGIAGSLATTASAGALIVQDSVGSQVQAFNSLIDLGAAEQLAGDVGTGTGGISVTVADNATAAVATANSASASLGGLSGSIATGGEAEIEVIQTLDSQVTASTGLVNAGITDANLGNVAGSGAASLTVSRNAIATAANGNDSRVDLGNVAASIDGTLGSTVEQSTAVDASLAASANDLRLGAIAIGELGTESPVAVSVEGNDVRTSATANNSVTSGALAGSLSGTVAFDVTQTLNGSAAGSSATTGSAVQPNVIGVEATTLGDNASVSVANNAVTSAVAGNRVLNNVQGAAFSSATGTLDYSATQTLNGNAAAAAVGDLASAVSFTTVGVVGGDTTLPATAISGNRLVADTVGNSSSRILNGLSGNFNAATQTVAMLDSQSVNDAVLLASVSDSQIGGRFISDNAVPTALTVNGNQVVAQAIANSSSQLVSLNGVSTSGGPLTSLNAAQNLINTSVTASISNVSVGLNNAGAAGLASFTGAAVTANNSLNATAIGNQASLVRNGR